MTRSDATSSGRSSDRVKVYATCPQSASSAPSGYRAAVAEVARWSEDVGCEGILVYTDNRLVDPWLVAQTILVATERIAPLVAVQPLYLHPYAAAKMVASLAHLHGRRVDLNMLAGGFKNDLDALGDATPHDERYRRTVEYASVMQRLLASDGPVDHDGLYYRLRGVRLSPAVPAPLAPGWMISGSSPAGLAAARALDAVAITYPAPAIDERPEVGIPTGVRVGLIARPTREEAWLVARERFPSTRAGQILHALATKTSDSHWHRRLSEASASVGEGDGVYWLGPFQHYQTFCPYLVGSYEEVTERLRAYVALGHRTFVLDIPPSRHELEHAGMVFDAVGAAGA